MALSKYTDPAVQNKTEDEATDRIDMIHSKINIPGKNKPAGKKAAGKTRSTASVKQKHKGFKEGNKDDSIPDEEDMDMYYTDNDDFFEDAEENEL